MAKMTELAPDYTTAAALLARKIKQMRADGGNPYIITQYNAALRHTRKVRSVLLNYYDMDRPPEITLGCGLKATHHRRGY